MIPCLRFYEPFNFSGYVLALGIALALATCRMIGMHGKECIGNLLAAVLGCNGVIKSIPR